MYPHTWGLSDLIPDSNMPRVLYLMDGLSNGGAERQFALLIRYLPDHWARRVWSMDDGPFRDVIEGTGVRVDIRRRSWQLDITPTYDLWRIIREWRPDVVHSWGWMSTLAAAPLCKHLRLPLIAGTIRGGMIRRRRKLGQKFVLHIADRVIANSHAGLEAWGVHGAIGRVVYNGFDPERLEHSIGEGRRFGHPFTIIMTGRMILEYKDYLAFIGIARKVTMDQGLPVRFVAVGDGPDRQIIMKEASDLVQHGSMVFPDPELDVVDMVRQASVGILLSPQGEGCSNSIMEYMACGLPVICNDAGGNRELVLDGTTGFLVPSIDLDAFVSRLLYLYDNPAQRIMMGRAGRDRILTEFSVEQMVARMIAVYSEWPHND